MSSAAQVEKIAPGSIDAKFLFFFYKVPYELELERLIFKKFFCFCGCDIFSREIKFLCNDFAHRFFNLREVFVGNGPGEGEVIIKAVFNNRADAEFCLGGVF